MELSISMSFIPGVEVEHIRFERVYELNLVEVAIREIQNLCVGWVNGARGGIGICYL